MRFLGHPLHPMLVHLPIACWILGAISDFTDRWLGSPFLRQSAAGLIALGCLTAVPAVLAGLLDFLRLPEDAEILRSAYRHLGLMAASWVLFGSAIFLQWTGSGWNFQPAILDFLLLLLGLVTLSVGGWYGSQLVYGHGVGVRESSHMGGENLS